MRLGVIAYLVLLTPVLWADGGVLQMHRQVGQLAISVFSTPTPLRVGAADLSVMVQNASDQSILFDADIAVFLFKAGQPNIVVRATRAQATNKLLYAARADIPAPGAWSLQVHCKERKQNVKVTGIITVLAEEPPLISYWQYFTIVPLAIGVYALNQWLTAKRRVRNRRARP